MLRKSERYTNIKSDVMHSWSRWSKQNNIKRKNLQKFSYFQIPITGLTETDLGDTAQANTKLSHYTPLSLVLIFIAEAAETLNR